MSILIKKYPNRRLYHTGERRYVNLEEIEQLVQRDVDFRVEDANSGQDLTRRILVQVLLEQMKEVDPVVPADFLKFLIRQRGVATTWQDTLRRFVPQGAASLPGVAEWMSWLGAGAPRHAPEPPPDEDPEPEPEPPPPPRRAQPPATAGADLQQEVLDLRQKMEQLERLLGGAAAPASTPRKGPGRAKARKG